MVNSRKFKTIIKLIKHFTIVKMKTVKILPKPPPHQQKYYLRWDFPSLNNSHNLNIKSETQEIPKSNLSVRIIDLLKYQVYPEINLIKYQKYIT